MKTDVTVAATVDGVEYQARLMNDAGVRVYRDAALVGTGHWDEGHIAGRDETVSGTVYDMIESLLRKEVGTER